MVFSLLINHCLHGFAKMNQLMSLLTLVFFLQLQISVSIDPHYDTCSSRKCGDLEITYPFRLINKQRSYCGYPGFEVSCLDGKTPYINISGDSYVIQNIWYENQSFQVINSHIMASIMGNDCSSSIKNLTLDNSVFGFANNHDDIILFRNCSDEILKENKQDGLECRGVAMYGNDPKLKDLVGKCGGVNSVPYDGERVSNFTKVLSSGVWLNWTANNCSDCKDTGGQCGFDRNTYLFRCFCSDRPHSYQCVIDPTHPKAVERSKWPIIVSVVVASALGIVISIALFIYSRRRKSTNTFAVLWSRGRTENQNVETFLNTYVSLAPKRYSYAAIRKMTNSFKDKLGEGGYGSVYKGKLHDGCFVAVKLLKQLKGDGEEFINEVASISRTNHVNIVTLVGFCFEGNKRALIYDFLSNGSLDKFIYDAVSGLSLPGETLFNIAVGTARGLDYIHRGCNARILHLDIKPHNILLDEDFFPKISDFGLARLCLQKDSSISMLDARGTIGYIAPEVFCRNFGGVSHKSDVYSYGMMVLDMVCGRKNISSEVQRSCDLYFPQWIYDRLEVGEELPLPLHGILHDEEKRLQRKMILVSLWCIQMHPSNRPSMSRVVEMLEGCLESLEMPPKPGFSSPPRLVFDSATPPQSGVNGSECVWT